MTHKTLIETFLNQKDFISHYHLILMQLRNIRKEVEMLIGGLTLQIQKYNSQSYQNQSLLQLQQEVKVVLNF